MHEEGKGKCPFDPFQRYSSLMVGECLSQVCWQKTWKQSDEYCKMKIHPRKRSTTDNCADFMALSFQSNYTIKHNNVLYCKPTVFVVAAVNTHQTKPNSLLGSIFITCSSNIIWKIDFQEFILIACSCLTGNDLYSATSINFLGSEPVVLRSSSLALRTEFKSSWLNGESLCYINFIFTSWCAPRSSLWLNLRSCTALKRLLRQTKVLPVKYWFPVLCRTKLCLHGLCGRGTEQSWRWRW